MECTTQDDRRRPITFKAPPKVVGWLQEKATAGYRSVNAQVLLLVEQAMEADQRQEARQ